LTWLTGSGALDPLDLNLTAVVNTGGWIGSETLDLDPTAQNACERRAAVLSRRRAAAAALGELAGVPNLGLRCTIWGAGDIYARRASTRSKLGRRSRRRCGGAAGRRGPRAPATAPRRRGARDRHLATPAGASPSCASPGWLHGDERAATAAETGEQRRRRSRVRVSGGARRKRRRLGFLG
jgi:hypothetical protein